MTSESVQSKCDACFTKPWTRKNTFHTLFCRMFALRVMKPSALRSTGKFWKGLTCQTKSQHCAPSLSLPPSLSLSLSQVFHHRMTHWSKYRCGFFFFLITSGSRRMSQGLLINCHNNCTKSSFWKWTIALFKWSMWQSEIYPTHFTALGIQHCHQDVRIIVLIPFFISFCPTSKISDHASMSAQRHIRLQLNANVGVLIKATQHLPTSPY